MRRFSSAFFKIVAGGLYAGWLLSQACGFASAQSGSLAATTSLIESEHRSATQMDAQDRSLVGRKQHEIAREAEFFGYDLDSGDWTYDEVSCPDIPGDLMLHYRSRSPNGAESLFTALVPRAKGRVLVVPVLFRKATPFHSAAGSERSLTVFNQSVPRQIAQGAVQSGGKWLQLAMCYAEVAGAEPQVPGRRDTETALVRAPVPTLRISSEDHSREVIFSDRNNPGQYVVWTVSMNAQGRVNSATARTFSDYRAQTVDAQAPREKVLPQAQEPPEKVLPPLQEPPEKVLPPAPPPRTKVVPQ